MGLTNPILADFIDGGGVRVIKQGAHVTGLKALLGLDQAPAEPAKRSTGYSPHRQPVIRPYSRAHH